MMKEQTDEYFIEAYALKTVTLMLDTRIIQCEEGKTYEITEEEMKKLPAGFLAKMKGSRVKLPEEEVKIKI